MVATEFEHVYQLAPDGTVYAIPLPPSPLEKVVLTPSKVMSNSRWGVKLMGVLAGNYTVSLAHYKTYLDNPSLRLAVGESPLDAWMEVSYPDVQITGASLSFWERHTNAVVRTEAAWFWDEPVFIPAVNTPLDPLPFPIPGIPGLPAQGEIPKKNILRYMIGVDKSFWIRSLNRRTMFLVSMQYFGTWVPDYDDRMRLPIPLYPDSLQFVGVKETESVFTFIGTTDYRNGRIKPQLVLAYDVRGAWMIQPSVNLVREPFRLMIQYSALVGNFVNFGILRDRDQIAITLSYLFN